MTIRALAARHGSTQSIPGHPRDYKGSWVTIRVLLGWLFGSFRGLFGGDYKGSTGDYLGVSVTDNDCRRLVIPGRRGCFGVV